MYVMHSRRSLVPAIAVWGALQAAAPSLAADGDLDPTFGTAGKLLLSFDRGGELGDIPVDLFALPDGSVLLGVNATGGTSPLDSVLFQQDWIVTRLDRSGGTDPTFGTLGQVALLGGPSEQQGSLAVARAADGKIVVAGEVRTTAGEFLKAWRLTPDGAPDPTFGSGGMTLIRLTDTTGVVDISDVAIQEDGRIVAVGSQRLGAARNQALVVRLTARGVADTSFDLDGKVTVPFDLPGYVEFTTQSGALQPDGRILIGGTADYAASGTDRDLAVMRLLPDGRLDSSFSGGLVPIPFDLGGLLTDVLCAMLLQQDGRILVAGDVATAAGPTDAALARLLPDGSLDPTFGTQGEMSFSFSNPNAGADGGLALSTQADGKILVAGYTGEIQFDFGVARVAPDGRLDPSFGSSGRKIVPFDLGGTREDLARSIAVQLDGKIVVAGQINVNPVGEDVGLVRLLNESGVGSGNGTCTTSATTLCLQQGRFQIEIEWTDFVGVTRAARVASFKTDDSGLFYYQDPNNLEFLIKVLDACSFSGYYWVFFAGTTDVAFSVSVTDLAARETLTYTNPSGQPADSVTDTAAFDTCP